MQKVSFSPILPPKQRKRGVNRRFHAKHAKYSNFCIIQTTNAIPTKFCTVINTTNSRCGLSQYLPHKSKMADGRHLEQRINCCISATVSPISTKFCMMSHRAIGPPNHKCCSKNQLLKNPRWRTAAILKMYKCDISATV